MQLGILQLLDAREAELDVELDYVGTLREYWTAMAELGALLAGQHMLAGTTENAEATPRSAASGEDH
jgi:hypothetical protein